jgi:hypothetical protein
VASVAPDVADALIGLRGFFIVAAAPLLGPLSLLHIGFMICFLMFVAAGSHPTANHLRPVGSNSPSIHSLASKIFFWPSGETRREDQGNY